MTREEEIEEKARYLAIKYCKDIDSNGKECYNIGCEIACKEMTEWADQHPRKGLWDAEKVCNILRNKMDSNWFYEKMERADYDSIIKDLHKAMEN